MLAFIGAAGGGLGALGITHLIRSNFYGITPQNPFVFILSALVLVLVAAIAAWLPAQRAARVNPVESLRAE
ncbi:MAG: hypothetical protein QM760_14120 [Nibricoccus sp.]